MAGGSSEVLYIENWGENLVCLKMKRGRSIVSYLAAVKLTCHFDESLIIQELIRQHKKALLHISVHVRKLFWIKNPYLDLTPSSVNAISQRHTDFACLQLIYAPSNLK